MCVVRFVCCGAPIVGEKYSEPNYESLFYINKNNTKISTRFLAGFPKIVR